MIKITMIVDNKIASPLAPSLFVLKKVISADRELFDIVEMTVEQEDESEKLKSHNTVYSKLPEQEEYTQSMLAWLRQYGDVEVRSMDIVKRAYSVIAELGNFV